MNSQTKIQLSRYMSLLLRHSIAQNGIKINENHWVDFEEFSELVIREYEGKPITVNDILHIVEHSEKSRFELADGKIRATYKHTYMNLNTYRVELYEPVNPDTEASLLLKLIALNRELEPGIAVVSTQLKIPELLHVCKDEVKGVIEKLN